MHESSQLLLNDVTGRFDFFIFRFPLTSLSVSPDARALSTSAHSKPCPKGMHKHRKVKYAESCLCYASI